MPNPPTVHLSKDDAFTRFHNTEEYRALTHLALDINGVHRALHLMFDAGWLMACGVPADTVLSSVAVTPNPVPLSVE